MDKREILKVLRFLYECLTTGYIEHPKETNKKEEEKRTVLIRFYKQ